MGTEEHFGERTLRGIEMLGALTGMTIYLITRVIMPLSNNLQP